MTPLFDPRPWGTFDLSPIYPDQKFTQKIGESWLTGDHCIVANGPLAGRRLDELSIQFGRELVGDAARDPKRFPLLLKFLFPQDKLSVQVHPDDEAAQRAGEPWGKTECWYVAYAQPGAQIALGLKPGATRAQLESAIHGKTAEDLLNWISVSAGDMIYVAAGTVHTMGAGSILVETQQQSDATYRLYDYGRPRQLHLERGLAAVKENARAGKVVHDSSRAPEELVAAPYFIVDKYNLKMPRAFSTQEDGVSSVQILVAFDGNAVVQCTGAEPVMLNRGDGVVVPACLSGFSVHPQGNVEFLRARVPGKPRPEPMTRL